MARFHANKTIYFDCDWLTTNMRKWIWIENRNFLVKSYEEEESTTNSVDIRLFFVLGDENLQKASENITWIVWDV